jgi:crossover junction endodeoxyribonuclease RusA
MIAVDLPWYSPDLHPNTRTHWAARARAAKKARRDAAILAKAAGFKEIEADRIRVTAVFSPPSKIRRDADGMLSSIKSALDGIADVIGVDDSKFEFVVVKDEPRKGGNVRIELEVVA